MTFDDLEGQYYNRNCTDSSSSLLATAGLFFSVGLCIITGGYGSSIALIAVVSVTIPERINIVPSRLMPVVTNGHRHSNELHLIKCL